MNMAHLARRVSVLFCAVEQLFSRCTIARSTARYKLYQTEGSDSTICLDVTVGGILQIPKTDRDRGHVHAVFSSISRISKICPTVTSTGLSIRHMSTETILFPLAEAAIVHRQMHVGGATNTCREDVAQTVRTKSVSRAIAHHH